MSLSLQARIALIVILPIVGLTLINTWLLDRHLREDLRGLVTEHHIDLTTHIAQTLGAALETNRRALTNGALQFPLHYLDDAAETERWLKERPGLRTLFDDLYVVSQDGRVLADQPVLPGRRGTSLIDKDWYRQTLESRAPRISEPRIGQHLNEPMLVFSVPMVDPVDPGSDIQGMLVGLVRLSRTNILDEVSDTMIGQHGYLYLISREGRYITHPDSRRVLTQAAVPGDASPLGQALIGYEGSMDAVDEAGRHNLLTYKRMPEVGWTLVAASPASEAYFSITQMRNNLLVGAAALLLVVLPLVWLLTLRTLRPLAQLRRAMQSAQADGFARVTPLSIAGQGELVDLAGRFDAMAKTIAERDLALREHEDHLREITTVLGFGVYVLNDMGRINFFNPAAERLLQWRQEEVLGQDAHLLFHHHHVDGTPYPVEDCPVHRVLAEGVAVSVEQEWLVRRDGVHFPVEIHATPILRLGKPYGAVTAFADISERLWTQERLRRQATRDPLTGLPNRRTLLDRLGQAIHFARREGRRFALIMLDLDGFKLVNDRLGHAAGDQLLRQFGQRVGALLRESDTVARLGGDEFTLLLPGMEGEAAARMAQKIIDSLVAPFALTAGECHVGASLGIAIYPEDGGQSDHLISAADTALYASKAAGKGCFRRATPREQGAAMVGMEDAEHGWRDEYALGIADIDAKHRDLLAQLDALESAIQSGADVTELRARCDTLLAAMRDDFQAEEELIEAGGLTAAYHYAVHQSLLSAVATFRARLGLPPSDMSVAQIRDWLIDHIREDDAEMLHAPGKVEPPAS